jgi:hypothetical protein
MRINSIGKSYKPKFACWGKKAVRAIVKFHKRMVRHAAKQYLKTGHRHDSDRMDRKLTDWDFD